MGPGNSIHNKDHKNRRASPIARFALIVIMILAVGFLIFYIIDNPGFLKNFKSSFSSSSEDKGTEEETSPDLITEEAVVGDPDTIQEGEDTVLEDPEETGLKIQETVPSTRASSLWQKIKNFFTRKSSQETTIETYPNTIQVNIYFTNLGNDEKLAPEERNIIAGDPLTAIQNTILELLNGPDKSYHFPVIPAGTKLLGVEVYENLAKIDFSQEFLENSLDSRILDGYIIYSIVNTITEIPDISGVIFLIEGKRIKLFGNIDLSIPASRNAEYIDEQQAS